MKKKVLSMLISTTMVVSQAGMIPTIVNAETVSDKSNANVRNDTTKNTTSAAVTVGESSTTGSAVSVSTTTSAAAIVDSGYIGDDGAQVDGIPTYKTIKTAISSIDANNSEEKIIFIKNGTYKEKLSINSPYITLVGESAENTIITYDVAAGTSMRTEDGGDGTSTYGTNGSATVTVNSAANNFKAANITIENSFDEAAHSDIVLSSKGQAVAMRNESNESAFVNCRFIGNQDTLYANKSKTTNSDGSTTWNDSLQYYDNCYIEGDVDFIFGSAQAVFENCEIHSVNRDITPKGYIAAPSTLASDKYGYLIENCKLTSDSNMDGQVYLGRPWHPSSTIKAGFGVKSNVVYKNCDLGSHIEADGWSTMSNGGTIAYPADNFMYEYSNDGAGANTSNENRRQLTDEEANGYTKENVLGGWDPSDTADQLSSYCKDPESLIDNSGSSSGGTTGSTTSGGSITGETTTGSAVNLAEQVNWTSTEFGQTTSKTNNTISVDNDNKTVTLTAGGRDGKDDSGNTSTGGKVTASQDGISYYYTEIDPSKNFDFSADVQVNYFEKPTPDKQAGFGIMARDTIGVDGDGSITYSNMCLVGGYRGAVESVFRNGIYKDSSGQIVTTSATMESETKLADRPANDGTSKYKLRLKKTNTGYIASVDDGTEVTYYRPKQLEVLDKDHIYLGFFAARVASITVSNIKLTESDVATDPAGETAPVTKITPAIDVKSPSATGETDYNLKLQPNTPGNVNVKLNGTEVYNDSTDLSSALTIPTTLSAGDNKFDIVFTPSQADDITSTDPVIKSFTVNIKSYGVENGDIYVSQDGTSTGDGTIEKPLDIYTAVKYAGKNQTIKVKGGTYNLTSPITIEAGNNGTEGNLKTLESYDGRAIFDFGKASAGLTVGGDYWKVYGIDVTNTSDTQHGITVSGNNNIVENVKTYKNGDTGLQISGSTSDTIKDWPNNNLILNCESYDNKDAAMNNADGFAAKISVGYGNVFRGCISHNNTDDGWDLYTKSENGAIGPVTIEDCIAYGNGTLTDGTPTQGDGNGFKLGGEGIAVTNTLKNSLSFNNNAAGITSNSNPAIVVENSISADNKESNIDLHTNTGAKQQFNLKDAISFRTSAGVADTYIDSVLSDDNYFYNGTKTSNKSGQEITKDYFKSIEMPTTIERDSDGNIIWPDYMNPINGTFIHADNSGTTNSDGSATTTSSSSSSHHHNDDVTTTDSSSTSGVNSDSNNGKDNAQEGNKWNKNADGSWSFINANGQKATGWIKWNDAWYLLNGSGSMQKGWVQDEGTWYYLNKDGSMETGWTQDYNEKWYYLNEDGSMKTGWIKDTNEKWYYLSDDGAMKTGWFEDADGKWYYLYDSGEMAVSASIDGYEIDDSGACIY